MKIVFDLQTCQTTHSAQRGVGRYTLELAAALNRHVGSNTLFFLINDTIEEETSALLAQPFIDAEHVIKASLLSPTASCISANAWRRSLSVKLMHLTLNMLKPDIVHAPYIFYGLIDNGISPISTPKHDRTYATVATLHDLTPLMRPDDIPTRQFAPYNSHYFESLNTLMQTDHLISISKHSRNDALQNLCVSDDHISLAHPGYSSAFKHTQYADVESSTQRDALGITHPFIFCTGGGAPHKNISGLIQAFGLLPAPIRRNHQLIISCSLSAQEKTDFLKLASQSGLEEHQLRLTGYVPDESLCWLYNQCALFVFPSFYEGFGLPILEAMACGAPVIASNSSSIPGVLDNPEALFDPHDPHAISQLIFAVLNDERRLNRLKQHSFNRAKQFSWDQTARDIFDTYAHTKAAFDQASKTQVSYHQSHKLRLAYVCPAPPSQLPSAQEADLLIPFLSQHYQIDWVINAQPDMTCWSTNSAHLIDVETFQAQAEDYGRMVFQVDDGKDPYCTALLQIYGGIAVMHSDHPNLNAHTICITPPLTADTPKALAKAYFDLIECTYQHQTQPTNSQLLLFAKRLANSLDVKPSEADCRQLENCLKTLHLDAACDS